MIRQIDAQNMGDIELKRYQLYEKGWRTTFTKVERFIALCSHDYKRIVISIPHLNARSDAELMDTIKHEIAHALCGPNEGHGINWINKCKEIGAIPNPCSPSNIDAGRALNPAEIIPTKEIKAIQNSCPICFKVAVELNSIVIKNTKWVKLKCGHLVKHDNIKSLTNDITDWTSVTGKKVFPYQVEGIRFIAESNGRCLIADEPGLGKTIQALGALKFYPEMGPFLWVCKSTLKLQAIKEAIDWCGIIGQVIEHGKMFIMPNVQLYVISMDLLRRVPTEKIEEIPYKTVVADEIQHFKNPDSTRTAELRKLVAKAEYFIPLSGTPWKNRGSEYFPVLNMLRPELFPSFKHFKHGWIDTYYDKKTGKQREGGIKNIPAFREKTKSFILRRMRDDVLPDLPPINRQIRFVDMEDEHKKAYDKEEMKVAAIIKAAIIDGVPPKQIASMMMSLKHLTGKAKAKVVIEDTIEWLENSPNDSEKMTIFHHHIDVGDLFQNGESSYEGLDKWLDDNGYNKTLRLLGGRGPEERNSIIESFKHHKENRILIGSTLASGEGLNIQFCQNAAMAERQWNPANEEQAELRFSRPLTYGDVPPYLQDYLFNEDKIAKKVSIRVPYYVAVGTIDEVLTNIVERKRHEFKRSMNTKDEFIKWDENEIINELSDYIIKKRFGKK